MGDGLRAALDAIIANSGEGGALQSGNAATRAYEKGYFGKIGTWSEYFVRQDVDDFRAVVRRFIDNDPLGTRALEIYPDLMLKTS
jgi:hypothetical protein